MSLTSLMMIWQDLTQRSTAARPRWFIKGILRRIPFRRPTAGPEREFRQLTATLAEEINQIIESTQQLAVESSSDKAQEIRTVALRVIPQLSMTQFPQTRRMVLNLLAAADLTLYFTSDTGGELGQEAEAALLEILSIPELPTSQPQNSEAQLLLTALYGALYKTTGDYSYAAKQESTLRSRLSAAEMDSSQELSSYASLGRLHLQLYRDTADPDHASKSSKYLTAAIEASTREAGTELNVPAILLHGELARLHLLLHAQTGEQRYEQQATDIFSHGLRLALDLSQMQEAPLRQEQSADTASGRMTSRPINRILFKGKVAAFKIMTKGPLKEFIASIQTQLEEIQRIAQAINNTVARGDIPAVGDLERLRLLCLDFLRRYPKAPPPMPQVVNPWGLLQFNLGQACGMLYDITKEESYFEESDRALHQALSVTSLEEQPVYWAGIHQLIGIAAALRYELTQDDESARKADAAFAQALKGATRSAHPQEWAALQGSRARLYLMLYGETRDDAYAAKSEEFVSSALEVIDRDSSPGIWGQAQYISGSLYLQRHNRLTERRLNRTTLAPEYLERAETAFNAALEVAHPGSSFRQWAITQMGLTSVLLAKISGREDEETGELLKAAEIIQKLISSTANDDPTLAGIWGLAQTLLGNVYRNLFDSTDDESYAGKAEECFKVAIVALSKAAPSPADARFGRHVNASAELAGLYMAVAKRRGTSDDRAIQIMESAARHAHVLPFGVKVNIAADFGEMNTSREAWLKAHNAYKEGQRFLDEEFESAQSRAEAQYLMSSYSTLYSMDALALVNLQRHAEAFALLNEGRARVLEEAMNFEEAARTTESDDQRNRLLQIRQAIFKGGMAARYEPAVDPLKHDGPDAISAHELRWREAITWDRSAEEFNEHLLGSLFTALGQLSAAESFLKEAASHAEVQARKADRERAAENVRSSVSHMIRASHLMVDPLNDEVADGGFTKFLREAQHGLIKGRTTAFPDSLAEMPIESDTAVVTLLFTPSEAIALLLCSGTVSAIPLPQLSLQQLDELIMGPPLEIPRWISWINVLEDEVDRRRSASVGSTPITPQGDSKHVLDAIATELESHEVGWLPAQDLMLITRNFSHRGARDAAERSWRQTVKQTIGRLQDSIWRPILDHGALPSEIRSVLISTSGWASLLPIHAAAPSTLSVAYTPSLNVWLQCQKRSDYATTDSLLLANPAADIPSLAYSNLLEQWIAEHFRDRPTIVLHGRQATREAVLFDSRDHGVIHFHGHARYRASEPLRSAIVCVDGELTLADIRRFMSLPASRLVVLGACSSAVTDVIGTGDEFVGLPAGFLEIGSPAVLASLWPVTEASTAFLMDHFYRLWREGGLSISQALHESARWLSQARKSELLVRIAQSSITPEMRDAISDLLTDLSAGDMAQQLGEEFLPIDKTLVTVEFSISAVEEIRDHPDDPPFSSPVYWAGFVAYGAVI